MAPTLSFALLAAFAGCGPSATGLSDSASSGDIEEGRTLYEQSCAACHGIGGVGTSQGPPFLHKVYEPSHHSDGAFQVAVANGGPEHHWSFGDMPPQPGVTSEELVKIVAYVRGIQRDVGSR